MGKIIKCMCCLGGVLLFPEEIELDPEEEVREQEED